MDESDLLQSNVFDLLAQTSDKTYIYLADLSKDYSRWSPAAVQYFGLSGEFIENTAQVWASYIHPEDRHIFLDNMGEIFAGKTNHHNCEYRARNARGEYVWVKCQGIAQRDKDGMPHLFAGTMTNLGGISKFDSVTGLRNLQELNVCLDDLLAQNKRGTLLLFGIDRFKRINDIYGYETGNHLLREFALELQRMPEFQCFRMDGDKIACIRIGGGVSEMQWFFDGAQRYAHQHPKIDGQDIPYSVSCGGVMFPENGTDNGTLRANAEYALEQAKQYQPGSLFIYSDDLHQKSMFRYHLREVLDLAVRNNFSGFSLNYQPLIDSADGTLYGAEALLRFQDPSLRSVSPADFIPILEDSGHIREVGTWVLHTALQQAAAWRKLNPDFRISVNVSYLQMRLPTFRDTVLQELAAASMPPSSLILELTESCNIIDPAQLKADFAFFAENNIKVALDDFGTGYASIAMLRELAPSLIKIDHTFVASISEKKLDQEIIEYILELCRHAGIQVCVEGVENRPILEIVRKNQPNYLQGYYFSRPLSTENFQIRYLSEKSVYSFQNDAPVNK